MAPSRWKVPVTRSSAFESAVAARPSRWTNSSPTWERPTQLSPCRRGGAGRRFHHRRRHAYIRRRSGPAVDSRIDPAARPAAGGGWCGGRDAAAPGGKSANRRSGEIRKRYVNESVVTCLSLNKLLLSRVVIVLLLINQSKNSVRA
jgi:hypothetical protein